MVSGNSVVTLIFITLIMYVFYDTLDNHIEECIKNEQLVRLETGRNISMISDYSVVIMIDDFHCVGIRVYLFSWEMLDLSVDEESFLWAS